MRGTRTHGSIIPRLRAYAHAWVLLLSWFRILVALVGTVLGVHHTQHTATTPPTAPYTEHTGNSLYLTLLLAFACTTPRTHATAAPTSRRATLCLQWRRMTQRAAALLNTTCAAPTKLPSALAPASTCRLLFATDLALAGAGTAARTCELPAPTYGALSFPPPPPAASFPSLLPRVAGTTATLVAPPRANTPPPRFARSPACRSPRAAYNTLTGFSYSKTMTPPHGAWRHARRRRTGHNGGTSMPILAHARRACAPHLHTPILSAIWDHFILYTGALKTVAPSPAPLSKPSPHHGSLSFISLSSLQRTSRGWDCHLPPTYTPTHVPTLHYTHSAPCCARIRLTTRFGANL